MNYTIKIFEIVFPVVALIALGFAYGRWKKLDPKVLAEIALFILSPAVMFDALAGRDINLHQLMQALGLSLAVYLIPGLTAGVIQKAAGMQSRIFIPCVMIMNAVSLPYPLALLAFGEEGLAQVVLLSIPNIFIVFSIGLSFHIGRTWSWEPLRMPALWAAVAGLAADMGGIPVPKFFLRFTHLTGRGLFPVELFTLGYRLRSIRISDLRFSLLVALLRCGLGFFTAWILETVFSIHGTLRAGLFLISCSPPAVLNYIFAERYGDEGAKAASVVFTGTIFSLITTPLLLLYLSLT